MLFTPAQDTLVYSLLTDVAQLALLLETCSASESKKSTENQKKLGNSSETELTIELDEHFPDFPHASLATHIYFEVNFTVVVLLRSETHTHSEKLE